MKFTNRLNSGIYIWINRYNNRVIVGQSCNLIKRRYQYLSDLRSNRHKNQHLQNAWNKYTEKAFEFQILELVENLAFLTSYEQSYLDYYRKLPGGVYNMEGPVEAPTRGHKNGPLSEATKRKISLANQGKSRNIGRKVSSETRKRLSQAHKGRVLSQEHKTKLSLAKKGKSQSIEHIAAAILGRSLIQRKQYKNKGQPNGRKGIPWSEARRNAQKENQDTQ